MFSKTQTVYDGVGETDASIGDFDDQLVDYFDGLDSNCSTVDRRFNAVLDRVFE